MSKHNQTIPSPSAIYAERRAAFGAALAARSGKPQGAPPSEAQQAGASLNHKAIYAARRAAFKQAKGGDAQ